LRCSSAAGAKAPYSDTPSNTSQYQLFPAGTKAANLFAGPLSAPYREVMSQREQMTDASLQQFLDDFIGSLEIPAAGGDKRR